MTFPFGFEDDDPLYELHNEAVMTDEEHALWMNSLKPQDDDLVLAEPESDLNT